MKIITKEWIKNLPLTIKENSVIAKRRIKELSIKRKKALISLHKKIERPKMNIEIIYDGRYPNLCSGNLIIIIDDKKWQFPDYCLVSGGSAGVDFETYDDYCFSGLWSINKWPENFPEELKPIVLEEINEKIPHGCCGGCI